MQLQNLKPIRKPRFHLENYTIDLYYCFPEKQSIRNPYYTAYINLNKDQNVIFNINGVEHQNIQGCFSLEMSPYIKTENWMPNHIAIFKKQGFFEHSTDNARSAFIKNIKEVLENIPEQDFQEAKLEALQKRVERQNEEVEKAEENLKEQQNTLNQYQIDLNEFVGKQKGN